MTLEYPAPATSAVGAVLLSAYRVVRAQYHVPGRAWVAEEANQTPPVSPA